MSFRITEAATNARLTAQITTSRQRLADAQDHLSSGRRINRLSDDPGGASAVFQLRTTQTQLEQFVKNADSTKDALLVGDITLDSYQQLLDRARVLLTNAGTSAFYDKARVPVATELEGIITRIQQLANTEYHDSYLFGGTRLTAPPYDINGVPATTATTEVSVQIEPEGTLIARGVTAESFLADANGTIVDALKTAATAIRGTGNETADKATVLATIDRVKGFADLASQSRTKIGERLAHLDQVTERLKQYNLSLEDSAQRIEVIDIAKAAIEVKEADTALNAVLQSASQFGRRSLLDFLG